MLFLICFNSINFINSIIKKMQKSGLPKLKNEHEVKMDKQNEYEFSTKIEIKTQKNELYLIKISSVQNLKSRHTHARTHTHTVIYTGI